jgi:CheY-like chemotaxis protein
MEEKEMNESTAMMGSTSTDNREERNKPRLMLVSYKVKGPFQRAKELMSQGKLEEAIEALTESIDMDTEDTLAYQSHFNRGLLYQRIGQEEKAMEDFKRAAELGNTKAQQLLKEKKEFKGSMGHQLNNLLMVIQGNLSLVLNKIDEGHPAWRNLKNIERQVESGIKLTGELLSQDKGAKQGKPVVGAEAALEPKTLLVVDDDALVLDIAVQMLEALGHRVLSAESAEKAMDIYQAYKRKIDLVVSDVVMPGMDGGELHREIKRMNPQAKVLLMSGYDKNHQAKGLIGPEDDFIQKPFNLEEISSKIQGMLDK